MVAQRLDKFCGYETKKLSPAQWWVPGNGGDELARASGPVALRIDAWHGDIGHSRRAKPSFNHPGWPALAPVCRYIGPPAAATR
jgi:hypothetical protein